MNELLTLEEIARLWKVTREHARRYIVRLPEFPEPAPGSTRKNQRWRQSEVLAFLNAEQPA
jgi:predicted DNA-binding transcriptional regulator AlpA